VTRLREIEAAERELKTTATLPQRPSKGSGTRLPGERGGGGGGAVEAPPSFLPGGGMPDGATAARGGEEEEEEEEALPGSREARPKENRRKTMSNPLSVWGA